MTGPAPDGGPGAPTWIAALLPGGVLLLVAAMAITVAGIPIAPLFRPGTWLILVALLAIAAGGAARLYRPGDDS